MFHDILRHVPSSEAVGIPAQSSLVLSRIVADPVLIRLLAFVGASDLYLQILFRFVSLLEELYLLSCSQYRYPHPVKQCKVIGHIVVGASHHIWLEPQPRKFSGQLVLVVEDVVVNQHPVAFLDLLWS